VRYRIWAAALVTCGEAVVLVKRRDRERGQEWWVPPGGAVKGAESLEEGAWEADY